MGISWGGKLAAAFARERPDLIAGFGMICPGLFAQQMPGPAQRWLLAVAGVWGWGRRRVTIPLGPELFTETSRWQAYIRHDPLTLRRVTVRFALADARLTRLALHRPEEITSPALLMLAGRERIVANRKVLDFFARISSRQKQVVQYPEAAHTLEFEPDPSTYFADLCRWARQAARS